MLGPQTCLHKLRQPVTDKYLIEMGSGFLQKVASTPLGRLESSNVRFVVAFAFDARYSPPESGKATLRDTAEIPYQRMSVEMSLKCFLWMSPHLQHENIFEAKTKLARWTAAKAVSASCAFAPLFHHPQKRGNGDPARNEEMDYQVRAQALKELGEFELKRLRAVRL